MVQHGLRAAAFWAALSVLSSLARELQNFSPARRSWACETASSANTLGHDQSTEPARLPQPSRAIGYMTAPISLWFSSKALIPSGMPSLSRGVHATSCISSPVWMPRAGKYKRAAWGLLCCLLWHQTRSYTQIICWKTHSPWAGSRGRQDSLFSQGGWGVPRDKWNLSHTSLSHSNISTQLSSMCLVPSDQTHNFLDFIIKVDEKTDIWSPEKSRY